MSQSNAEGAETLQWAISLLEIHEGVRANPNSQMWLGRLRKMLERAEQCSCGCKHHNGSCWDALEVERKMRANSRGQAPMDAPGDDAPPTNSRLTSSSLVVGDDAPTPKLSVEIQEGYEPRCPEIASFEKRCSRQEGHPGHHDWTAVAPGAAALREPGPWRVTDEGSFSGRQAFALQNDDGRFMSVTDGKDFNHNEATAVRDALNALGAQP